MNKNKIEIKIRGYHIDLFGHVNNARYLEFLEEARWSLDAFDFESLKKKNLGFAVVNININYLHPACFGDIIEIITNIEKIKNRSAIMSQKIYIKGTQKKILDAKITYVVFDMLTKKAISFDKVNSFLKRK